MLDDRKNFSKGLLASGITDVATTLTMSTGDAAKFPDVTNEYNVVIWDIDTYPNPADDTNVEIVRVTNKVGTTFTITRGQEGTTGVAHSTGAGVALTLTSKMIDDIEKADNSIIEQFNTPTYKSVQDWMNITQSSGLISGGEITDNGDGSVTVGAGEGFLKTEDSQIGATKFFKWNEDTNVSLVDDGSVNHICVCYNAGVVSIEATTDFNSINWTTHFLIARVYREGLNLSILKVGAKRYDLAHRVALREYILRGFERGSGLVIGSTGVRYATLSQGIFYALYEPQTISAIDTSVSGTIRYWYRDGAGGWNNFESPQYNNSQYDDGSGTLANLTSGYLNNLWVYVSYDGKLNIVLGRQDAKDTNKLLRVLPSDLPKFITEFCLIVGRIAVQQGTDTLFEIDSSFETVFQTTSPTDHPTLSNLGWTVSGHSGTISNLAGFDTGGKAKNYTPTEVKTLIGSTIWNIATADANMSINNGYIANKATLLTMTLPDTAPVNSVVRIAGLGAGGWKIAQNAGEIIHFGNVDTTAGTGYLASTHIRDAVELICVVANTEWNVISSQGNIEIV